MGRLFYSFVFLSAFLSFRATSYSQSFSLVRDINLGREDNLVLPTNLTEAGNLLFFTIRSGTAAGLWKTDGTDAGTIRIKAISASETVEAIIRSNNQVFFTIHNDNNGASTVWKTDGTDAGTFLLESIPGYRILFPTAINGDLFFVVNTGSSRELWKSNGTPGGVTTLKTGATAIQRLTDVNGTLFFIAAEPAVPYSRLWKTNGTAAGTELVKDIYTGGAYPGFFTLFNANGTLFFRASDGVNGDELWKSNGTAAGTVLVKDIAPGAGGSNINSFVIANNLVYFFANTTGDIHSLWSSDGTTAGTTMIAELQENPYTGEGPNNLTVVNGTLFFQGYDDTHGIELWKSDGTTAGTSIVKDFIAGPGGIYPTFLFNANGILYFVSAGSIGIWKSDGTGAGTVLVKDGFMQALTGGAIAGIALANGTVFFSAYDPRYGYELWKTDGTTGGTTLVKNIISTPDSNPQNFVAANGLVYFTALSYINNPGPQLGINTFQTDGTLSETKRAERINVPYFSTPLDMASHNGALYISGRSGSDGYELWKIGGAGASAVKVKNINPIFITTTGTGSNPNHFQSCGQFLYFSADDGTNGNELWKTDGTEAGTMLVKDINPVGSSNPDYLVNVNGTLFFIADNGTDGIELWKSDGTAAGTVLVRNINTGGSNTSVPSLLTAVNGTLFFGANDGVHGYELWKSDGTEAGTVMVKDINGLPTTSNLEYFTNINGILYFTANDGIHGREAWKSDGTEAGTVLLKDIYPGPSDGYPSSFTYHNGIVLFAANDGIAGYELWGSDGTTAGTILVKDINPGAGFSSPFGLTKVGGNILFAADDGVHGTEVWLSNGTESGTRMMGEIQPGAAGSNPTEIFEFGSKVLVAATNELTGYEIWIADVPAGSPLPLELLEFKGSVVNNDGLLRWKTDNEQNTSSFIIERSLDGRSYTSVGSVSSANSPGVHYYDFTDVNIVSLGANNIYYRLKQTDIDGRYTYSNIVVLSMDHEKSIVMLYPNPAKDKINMTITISQSEKLQWQLTDNTGRAIKKGIYNLSAGSTALSIDVANLASGTYLVQLNGTTLQKVFKVIKQ